MHRAAADPRLGREMHVMSKKGLAVRRDQGPASAGRKTQGTSHQTAAELRRPGRRVGREGARQGRYATEQAGGARIDTSRKAVRHCNRGGIDPGARDELRGEFLHAAIRHPAPRFRCADDGSEIRINRGRPGQRSPLHPFVEPVEIALGRRVHASEAGAKFLARTAPKRSRSHPQFPGKGYHHALLPPLRVPAFLECAGWPWKVQEFPGSSPRRRNAKRRRRVPTRRSTCRKRES